MNRAESQPTVPSFFSTPATCPRTNGGRLGRPEARAGTNASTRPTPADRRRGGPGELQNHPRPRTPEASLVIPASPSPASCGSPNRFHGQGRRDAKVDSRMSTNSDKSIYAYTLGTYDVVDRSGRRDDGLNLRRGVRCNSLESPRSRAASSAGGNSDHLLATKHGAIEEIARCGSTRIRGRAPSIAFGLSFTPTDRDEN